MSIEMVARTIQYILAPVVMITACAILQSGLLGHYAEINTRLRALNHERFELVMGGRTAGAALAGGISYETERLREIDHQMPGLLHRLRLVRDSSLVIYAAVFFFIVDMGVIGAAILSSTTGLANLALAVFLVGLVALLWGILLIVVEIRGSHRAVEYEVERVLNLAQGSPERPADELQTGKTRQSDGRTNQ
jgi:hypothetical protein